MGIVICQYDILEIMTDVKYTDGDIKACAPTVIVVMGATGDLTKRKIIPALYKLFVKKHLPEKWAMVGFSRQALSDEEFQERMHDAVSAHSKENLEEKTEREFLKTISYVPGQFQENKDYASLAKELERIDLVWGMCSNKLFYLAVPPDFYKTIFENLDASGLTKPCGDPNWTRVVVEKPFGKNLETAQDIDRALGAVFKEEQIYRIDHYFGKEMVQNMLAFRFSNILFKNIWDNKTIEKIEVRLLETIGIEKRGSFYDGIGALRDVGQNHLLQVLALTTMEHPIEFSAISIRNARLKLLEELHNYTEESVLDNTFRAQYEGYKEEVGVDQNSTTETYFRIKTSLNNSRFEGVPIILEGGKCLGEEQKEVVITLQHPEKCLCPHGKHYKNTIIFHLAPKEGITIRFFAKKAGRGMEVQPRDFTFDFHGTDIATEHVGEYERLLIDCIIGDQTLFVQTKEVQAMWEFVDPIISAWQENKVPLEVYKKGSGEILEKAKL
jgi:glucose-6-phosphate 1-dehydrogenase